MKTLKINKECFVPRNNVLAVCGYTTAPVKNRVQEEKKNNNVIDMTFGKKIQSVVFLTDGKCILANTSIETLDARFNKED